MLPLRGHARVQLPPLRSEPPTPALAPVVLGPLKADWPQTLWPVPATWLDPDPLPGAPPLTLNRPGHALNFTPRPSTPPPPPTQRPPPLPSVHTFPPFGPDPQPPLPPSGVATPGAPQRRRLSSPSPGFTQSSGLTARPVPGAATSAGPGPRAVEPPLLRGPGRHPFPRPLPPTPPRLRFGSPPLPRAAPPRPAGAAVSGPRVPQPPPPPLPPRSGIARAAWKARTLDRRALGSGFGAGVETGAGERRGNPEPGWRSQILGLGMRGHKEPGLESALGMLENPASRLKQR